MSYLPPPGLTGPKSPSPAVGSDVITTPPAASYEEPSASSPLLSLVQVSTRGLVQEQKWWAPKTTWDSGLLKAPSYPL